MSTALHIPEWDLADRMRKSLKDAGIGVGEMADRFEVHRNTISAWINGTNTPDALAIRAWAAATNVPVEWLRWGVDPTPDGGSEQAPSQSGCFGERPGSVRELRQTTSVQHLRPTG